jgi:aryl-alcohol dehydrogenase-like predicted oxidoreductase
MQQHAFGQTGLSVSVLGLGAGQVGDANQSEAEVGALLNTALDLGMTLVDTARGYGLSEERIGRHIAHRRSEYVLSTKVGYGVPGHQDWNVDCIIAGVDLALRTMKTDVLDIVHLHSCPKQILLENGVIDALIKVREQGKIRIVAYSGENDELAWAVNEAGGKFGSVECSVNPFDQLSLGAILPSAGAQGMGVIAKRALGNAPWRFAEQPHGNYCETYWLRKQEMALDIGGLDWDEFSMRFSAFAPNVSCAIVGTSSIANLRRNIRSIEAGPLPEALFDAARGRFMQLGAHWQGEI